VQKSWSTYPGQFLEIVLKLGISPLKVVVRPIYKGTVRSRHLRQSDVSPGRKKPDEERVLLSSQFICRLHQSSDSIGFLVSDENHSGIERDKFFGGFLSLEQPVNMQVSESASFL
jgi:hypothetical protein